MKITDSLYRKFRTCLLIGLITFGFQLAPAWAQNGQEHVVTGEVVDGQGIPILGATILSETGVGVITDLDGQFSIQVKSLKETLTFSYLGYITQKVSLAGKTRLKVTLSEDLQQLDEVVVIGYGIQQKSHLTGSIAKVNPEGLVDLPLSRIDQALQGKVAGLQIRNTTSEVGEAPQIRVRGMGSISADAGPLVIVDGFPMEEGLGVVNMNDVESIEVLKDAASSAIYGSRAANGVIMITTKSGSANKPKYTVKTSYGFKDAYKLHPIMNAGEYVDMRVRELRTIGAEKMPDEEFAYMVLHDMNGVTGWQDMPLRTAAIYNAQFSVSGGSKDVRYYISGSYTSDEGIMEDSKIEKYNVRAKIDATLSKRVKVGINIAPTITDRVMPGTNFQDYYKTPSWMPARHNAVTSALTGVKEGVFTVGEDFNYKDYAGYDPVLGEDRVVNTRPYGSANPNPASRMYNIYKDRKDYRVPINAYLDIEILKGLTFRSSNGVTYNYSDINTYQNFSAAKKGETNKAIFQSRMNLGLVSENTLNFSKTFKNVHDINALVGFSAEKTNYKNAAIVGQDFPTDYIHTLNAAGTILLADDNGSRQTGTWRSEESMASFYARLNYAYDNKYLFSGTLRADGSSKFGKDNRWGYFPSVSIGWRISEEAFIKDNFDWINQLKVRGSYGITGTDNIANYANTNTVDVVYYPMGSSGSVTSGLTHASSSMGNPSLKWEQTNEFNYGLDVSLFNSRIGLTLDYYYSTTKSLLFERDINSISGFTKAWTNLGKIQNRGLEIELTTHNVTQKDFSWSTSMNFATNSNKLISLGGPEELISTIDKKMFIARVGDPAIQYYGFKTVGTWATMEEINNNPHHISDTRPGGLRVWNANNDDVINDQDLVPLGSPFPDFTWGITNNLRYKDFDLSVMLQGSVGGKVWNNDETINETRKWNKLYVKGRWLSEEHPGNGKTPFYNYGIDHALTDYPIQDASYVSLRDVTLGYTLSKKALKKTGLGSMRVYLSAQNLWYWWPSSYRGINPEALYTGGSYSSPLVSGYQQGAFPVQRVISFGLDINF